MLMSACKKDGFRRRGPWNQTPESTTPVVTEPVAVPASSYAVPTDATVLDLGTGSGYLTIDGNTLNIANNTFIRIKGGNYKGITIKNILANSAKPVYIKNVGQVNISEGMSTENITNVIIDGDYTAGLTYGFQFNNISYRAIILNGKMSGVVIKSMSFTNVGDYTISGNNSDNGTGLAYKGTPETRTDGFKLLNCSFTNAGSVIFSGALNKDTGEDSGLFKDVEVAYNNFQNSPGVGSVVSFANVQDYNIHHNTVDNINQSSTNHNGVFLMQGNGSFHENKLTNYQGNAIRMWLYSRGSTPAVNQIYNNICYNTKKYGGFELQAFDRNIVSGKSTFANAKVYNNTVGQMNTNKDWEGQVLDLYNTGGTLEYYNNLGYNLTSSSTIGNMINNMSDVKITQSNNKYFSLYQNAVSNLTTFASLAAGTGASL